MDPKVNYTAVGLYVIILSLSLAALVLWLSSDHRKHYDCYLVYMKESVSGLNEKAPVKFNGVDVGYVKQISIDSDDPQEVQLVVEIDHNVPITKSTTATLMAQGITGITYIGLKAKTSNAPKLLRHEGQSCPVIPSEPSLLLQLNEALQNVTEGLKGMSNSFQSMSESVKNVLNPANLTALENILTKISTTSNQFPETLEKVNSAAGSFGDASKQLKISLQKSESTLRSVDLAAKGLAQQTLPEIAQAAKLLKDTLENVKVITNQMKQNPSVIIRGAKPTPLGPGE